MDDTMQKPLDRLTRYGLVLLAVVQGWVLYLLHLAWDNGLWPATDGRWLTGLYTLAVGLPAFLFLGMERLRDRRNLIAAALLGALLLFLGWHLGRLHHDIVPDLSDNPEFVFSFVLSVGVTLFVLALYFRAWSLDGSQRFGYARLLAFSWQQALTLGLLALFVGVFWMLLWLWAFLFKAIGVELFFGLFFEEPFFAYTATGVVLGLGLVIIRSRIGLIATVQSMCEVLIKAVLPLVALIALLFLGVLPVTGLQPIWETGRAAVLMMVLAVVLLFFFNGALSESADRRPYPRLLRVFVLAGIAVLPLHAALAGWALWLRIDQYGLTVDRLWAAVILFFIAAYALSYAALLPWRRGDGHIPRIQEANKILAYLVVGVLIAVNTPLADLRAWAAESQAERLTTGRIAPEKFELEYLRFDLGVYGVRALRGIRDSELAGERPEVGERVAAVLAKRSRWGNKPAVDTSDTEAVAGMLQRHPSGAAMPEPLLRLIVECQEWCLGRSGRCRAVRVSFPFGTGGWLVYHSQRTSYINGSAYTRMDGRWRRIGHVESAGCPGDTGLEPAAGEALAAVPGPVLAYTDGECFFRMSPDAPFLKGMVERAR